MASGRILVLGIPQPQGNKTAFVVKGRAVLVEGRRKESRASFQSWRQAVAHEAAAWAKLSGLPAPIDGPVRMDVTFSLPRPKSAPKRVLHPAARPDVDKLLRAVLDSLTGIVFTDDARVVKCNVEKKFATTTPGAEISWQPL